MLSKLTKDLIRVSHDEVCSILEDFEIQQSLNLGAALVHTGHHENMGRLVLVSDVSGGGAYLPL